MNVVVRFKTVATLPQWDQIGCKSRYQPGVRTAYLANISEAHYQQLLNLMQTEGWISAISIQPEPAATRR